MVEQTDFRLRSVRGARRGIEMALEAHREGRLSSTGLNARVSAYKAWVEVFLVEQELMKLNMDAEAPDHPLGFDGGIVLEPVNEGVIRQVKRKAGVGVQGAYDEQVEVTSWIAPPGVDDYET
jgi:hypothetical protein